MDLKIYGEDEQKQSVHLRLFYDEDSVVLAAVDPETGRKVSLGNLISIRPFGKITRRECVDPKLGFELDEHGRIKLDE